jgi:hypothetical protein
LARSALLGPSSDARDVMRVVQACDAHTVLLRPLDRDIRRLRADRLAEAAVPVHADERPVIRHDLHALRGSKEAEPHVVEVARHEPDAVRIVAEEVGLGEALGNSARLILPDAGGDEGMGGGVDQCACVDMLHGWVLRTKRTGCATAGRGGAPCATSARSSAVPPSSAEGRLARRDDDAGLGGREMVTMCARLRLARALVAPYALDETGRTAQARIPRAQSVARRAFDGA